MASIEFSASLNTDKLESSINQSNKTIKDWVKGVEEAGGKAEKGFDKATVSFKDTIKAQKDLIKSIEKEVKELQKTYDSMEAGRAKFGAGGIGEELGRAKRALTEERGTLLGLQQQQIDANSRQEESQNKIVTSLKNWAVGLVSVGAALKIAKSIIDSTEATQLKFKSVMAQATEGINYFFKAIASGDWSNFFHGIEEAIKGARDFVYAMDDLENKRNELNIKTSELDIKIGEARAKSYDADIQVMKGALTEIIELQKIRFTLISDLSKKEYQENLKHAASQSGLEKEKIEGFLREYSSLEDLIKKGEEYNKLQKLMYGPGVTNTFLDELQKQVDILGPGAEQAGKYVQQISKVTPETRKLLSDFLAQQNKDIAAFNLNNRRDKQRLITIEKQEVKDKIEAAKIENQIQKERELLNKAITDANEKEIKSISIRIIKLEEELALREKLAEQAISAAITRESVPTKITGLKPPSFIGFKTPSDLAKSPALFQEESKYIANTTMLTKKALAEVQKAKEKYAKDDEKADKEKIARTQEIISEAIRFTGELAYQLDLTQEETEALGVMTNTIMQLAQGNYLGAALGVLAHIIGVFTQMGNVVSEPKWKAQIEAWDALIERQQRVIELSERTGGTAQALRDAVDMAQKEFDILNEQALKYKTVNIFGWESWNIPSELAEMWIKAQDALHDAQQALTDFIIGGVNQIDIAGVLAQGFEDGKKSARDFAEDFDGLMRQAINSSLEELSKPSISAWYQKFAADMTSGGGLNAEEIVTLKREWETIVAAEEERRKQVYAIAGITDNAVANVGLTGQIRRDLTEETGTELVALFRRYADEQRVVKDYSIRGVAHLVGIELNTAETSICYCRDN
jgi:hypothetical protein